MDFSHGEKQGIRCREIRFRKVVEPRRPNESAGEFMAGPRAGREVSWGLNYAAVWIARHVFDCFARDSSAKPEPAF
jgi:hypothetical protein